MPMTHASAGLFTARENPPEALADRLRQCRESRPFQTAMDDTIDRALAEDIGPGDVTSEAIFTPEQTACAQLVAKDDGILAGLPVFLRVFAYLGIEESAMQALAADGQPVHNGQTLARISGPVIALLKAERVALNLLQRASGIATQTHRFVQAARQTGATDLRVLDTRKTAPNLRWLDKYAVLAGGGDNHRHGLYDMALIKENHIQATGGITAAVNKVRQYQQRTGISKPIEVEVTSLDELREALGLKPDRILLDNMDDATVHQAVAITAGAVPLEASGNVTLQRLPGLAKTGVDCVSIGALTHSVQALDLSLLIESTPSRD